jgi:hypothetical protein
VSSASAFVACVTPAAPGVTDTTFASDPEPVTHMTDSKVTGIAKPARKTAITPSLQSQDRKEGRKARVRYSVGRVRITPPCFACSQSFFTFPQKMRPSITTSMAPPTRITIADTGCSLIPPPRFSSKLPGTERKRYR